VRQIFAAKLWVACLCIVLTCCVAWAQGAAGDKPKPDVNNILDQPGRLFDMKVPKGFEPVATEEAGTLRWRKGVGEIQLVVGELQYESADKFFRALCQAAESNDRLQSVRILKLRGGKGLAIREKSPKDPDRLRIWRLFAISKKKIFSVEFSSPEKNFDSFEKDFKKALKSFRLKSSK